MCIDCELVEPKAGHEPSRVLDALWRLNEKAEGNGIALVGVDAAHTEAEAHLQAALATAMETLRAEAKAQGESLQHAIVAVRRMLKRLDHARLCSVPHYPRACSASTPRPLTIRYSLTVHPIINSDTQHQCRTSHLLTRLAP